MTRAYVQGGEDFAAEFKWMDTNNDGVLDWGEFKGAMQKMVKLTQDEARCLRAVFDADSDGSVSFGEFMGFVNTRSNELSRFTTAGSPRKVTP